MNKMLSLSCEFCHYPYSHIHPSISEMCHNSQLNQQPKRVRATGRSWHWMLPEFSVKVQMFTTQSDLQYIWQCNTSQLSIQFSILERDFMQSMFIITDIHLYTHIYTHCPFIGIRLNIPTRIHTTFAEIFRQKPLLLEMLYHLKCICWSSHEYTFQVATEFNTWRNWFYRNLCGYIRVSFSFACVHALSLVNSLQIKCATEYSA